MRKRGHTVQLPFGGFIYTTNTEGLKLLKAVGITALCNDDYGMEIGYEIPSGHFVVGVYVEGKVFILILNGEIKHDMWRLSAPLNNVVNIKQLQV
ncbi:hypothetical protein C1M56_00950 [Vibrio diazotrophicus]|nr:hypothetical protein C1M56_00950 [Vibrio diazotrophicus]